SRHHRGPVVVWEVETGKTVAEFDAGPNSASTSRVSSSPDRSVVATGGDDHVIRLWGAQNGKLLSHLPDMQMPDLGVIRFSRDGTQLAVPDKDGRVRVLSPDREDRGPVDRLGGHTDWVYLLRFSPDGKTLMSASYDQTIKLWDFPSGRE